MLTDVNVWKKELGQRKHSLMVYIRKKLRGKSKGPVITFGSL